MGMRIIELTRENIDQYLTGCLEVQQFLVKPGEQIDPEQFRTTAQGGDRYFVAVVEADCVVGLGVINKIVHPVRTNAYIDNIVVHADFRGRGYFTAIMNELETKAREWGADGVKLTCSRPEVQPLYEKRGYAEKTSTKYYVKKL